MLLPALSRAREQARTASCMSNLRQVMLGATMYAHDFDDYFPVSEGAGEGQPWYAKLWDYGINFDRGQAGYGYKLETLGGMRCPSERRTPSHTYYVNNRLLTGFVGNTMYPHHRLPRIHTPGEAVVYADNNQTGGDGQPASNYDTIRIATGTAVEFGTTWYIAARHGSHGGPPEHLGGRANFAYAGGNVDSVHQDDLFGYDPWWPGHNLYLQQGYDQHERIP